MRNSFVVIALFLSLFSQIAAHASCDGDLTTQPSFEINLEIVFDEHGQPQLRQVPGRRQPVAPQPVQPVRPSYAEARVGAPAAVGAPLRPRASLSAHFKNLMNHGALIYQNDYRLANRGLLVENGGLCGSTCGVNVVHAMVSYAQGDLSNFPADYYIHRIVDNTMAAYSKDARMGINLQDLSSGLQVIARDLGLKIHTDLVNPANFHTLTLEHMVPAENELLIVSIQSGIYDGKTKYHAIVVTDANPTTREIVYSDPNHPNQTEHSLMQSHFNERGDVSVKIGYRPSANTSDGYTGVVNEILRVKISRPEDFVTQLPAVARQAMNDSLVGRWVVVRDSGRKFVNFLSRIKDRRETLSEDFGYVLGFGIFGSSSQGTHPFGGVDSIEELKPKFKAAELEKLAGKNIKIKFNPMVERQMHRPVEQDSFPVIRFERHAGRNYPNGALVVQYETGYGQREELLPIEFIDGFSIVRKKSSPAKNKNIK